MFADAVDVHDVVDEHGHHLLVPNALLHGLFLNKQNDAGAASVALSIAACGLAARQRALASRHAAKGVVEEEDAL